MVQAQDNGYPSLSTTITVYCNVLDLNDNAPVFDPMSYSNEIFENVPIGMDVVMVSATDIDSGEFCLHFILLFSFIVHLISPLFHIMFHALWSIKKKKYLLALSVNDR